MRTGLPSLPANLPSLQKAFALPLLTPYLGAAIGLRALHMESSQQPHKDVISQKKQLRHKEEYRQPHSQ